VLDGDESTGLEEGEGVGRVGDDVSEILTEFLELLLPVVVLSDGFLVGDDDLGAFDLGETEFCGERGRTGGRERDRTRRESARVSNEMRREMFEGRKRVEMGRSSERLTLLELGNTLSVLELEETPLEHELGTHTLDSQQIENHVVAEMERRIQPIRLSLHHVLGRLRLQLLIHHHHHDSSIIQPSSTRSPAHLYVLSRTQVPELLPVELPDVVEDDRLGGHVESDGEGLGSEEYLDESFLEEDLDDFLEDGEESSVMDSDSSLEEREEGLDLREVSVVFRESVDSVFEDGSDEVSFVVGVELEFRHLESESFALPFREGEDDDGVEVLDHDHLDDLVDVRDS